MKKLIFLTMIFGLVMIFSVNASAQATANFAVGQGSGTPKVGDVVRDAIHARINNEPEAPSGTKYLAMNFLANGKSYAGAAAKIPAADQNKYKVKVFGDHPIKKVENPIAFRAYDTLKITYSNMLVIEVIRGGKSQGVMKLYF